MTPRRILVVDDSPVAAVVAKALTTDDWLVDWSGTPSPAAEPFDVEQAIVAMAKIVMEGADQPTYYPCNEKALHYAFPNHWLGVRRLFRPLRVHCDRRYKAMQRACGYSMLTEISHGYVRPAR